MSLCKCLRFVSSADVTVEEMPWGAHEWLVRSDVTENQHLQLVRVTMPPGQAHRFHRHPCFEEFVYVVSGRAKQWVGEEHRILLPGDVAHVPMDRVHGTYNVFDEPVVFLAAMSPTVYDGPDLVDVSGEEPWCSLESSPPASES